MARKKKDKSWCRNTGDGILQIDKINWFDHRKKKPYSLVLKKKKLYSFYY